jgi:hypothetical protein
MRWSIAVDAEDDEDKDLNKIKKMKFHQRNVNGLAVIANLFLLSVDDEGWIVMWEIDTLLIID